MLFCMQKTSSLTFFLRYCKEIANLLFYVIWACLATQTPKMIKAIWRNLWCLSLGKRSSSSLNLSLKYYKDIVNLLLVVLWACMTLGKPIVLLSTCKKLLRLFAGIKSTLAQCFSGDTAKMCKFLILDTLVLT